MAKLTLKEKKLLNEQVTGETKRCLAAVDRNFKDLLEEIEITSVKPCDVKHVAQMIAIEIIKSSPYIEFNKDLLKRIPK